MFLNHLTETILSWDKNFGICSQEKVKKISAILGATEHPICTKIQTDFIFG